MNCKLIYIILADLFSPSIDLKYEFYIGLNLMHEFINTMNSIPRYC